MPSHNYHESPLEIWLKENKMSTNEFVALIGCSRPTIWKAKRGIAISPGTAKKIYEFTNGDIKVEFKSVGKPVTDYRLINSFHNEPIF